MLKLFNTISRSLETFTPLTLGHVKMYNCGPTVGNVQHIGNLLPPVYTNVLRKTLELWGYEVEQVTNITDFGHLTSDADDGEDKMTMALLREKLPLTLENMSIVAEKFASVYFDDVTAMGVDIKKIPYPRASEYIPQQIALISSLQEKGYAYETSDGVYFDTALLPQYGKLGGLVADENVEESRVEARAEKHSPHDFALWKKSPSGLGWGSTWGQGFPGWHTECVAMIFALLGKQIDIHTGGIEHIAIHHNNEIAQAETVSGKAFAHYWLHNNHITIDGKKISKSLGNTVYLSDIIGRGLSPLALRYWFLTGHYRTPMNFTWDALEGAETARKRLIKTFSVLEDTPAEPDQDFVQEFNTHLSNDLSTAQALARVWELVKSSEVSPATKRASMLYADTILGIGLASSEPSTAHTPVDLTTLSTDVAALVERRLEAKRAKDFALADSLRKEIEQHGFDVKDTPLGSELFTKPVVK